MIAVIASVMIIPVASNNKSMMIILTVVVVSYPMLSVVFSSFFIFSFDLNFFNPPEKGRVLLCLHFGDFFIRVSRYLEKQQDHGFIPSSSSFLLTF